jgi:HSP20 family protein
MPPLQHRHITGTAALIRVNAAPQKFAYSHQVRSPKIGELVMAQAATKVPLKTEQAAGSPATLRTWEPFEALRRQIDSLFAEFHQGMWRMPFSRATFDVEPFWRTETAWGNAPAVDVVEKPDAYEITAELPGMDEKNVEVKLANEMLTIKGEKKEDKEEKEKDYYLSERRYGSFQRSFRIPEGVDTDKIVATFQKGILTVMLPKKAEVQKSEKKVEIKAA